LRAELKEREGRREKFSGVFVRLGHKKGWKGKQLTTILLSEIKDSSGAKTVADHIWLNETKGIKDLGELKEGELLEFEGRVKTYFKGYMGYREDASFEHPISQDYKISHPTNIRRALTQALFPKAKSVRKVGNLSEKCPQTQSYQ
jgi:hypothetical protein